MRRRILALSCSVVLGAGLAAAGPAASAGAAAPAGAWTVDPITMQASGNPELAALDCADSAADGTCIAVGSMRGTDGSRQPLIQRRGAAGWTDVPAVTPRGSEARLTSISCTSSTHCSAVGRAAYGRRLRAFVERSNVNGWRLQASPVPAGAAYSELSGISCVSATFCVAVGDAGSLTTRSAFIETWDGSAWHIDAAPDTGLPSTKLLSVDCTSPVFCAAVGAGGPSATTTTSTVQEVWNGATWEVGSAQTGDTAELTAVDCTAPTFCLAVGDLSTSQGDLLAGERWNGTAWAAADPATPAGSDAELHGISCVSPSYCAAVGTYDLDPGLGVLARRWDGSAWVRLPEPFAFATLFAVNCFSAGQCEAVGSGAETFDGSAWTLESTPNDRGAPKITRLNAVSCAVSATCLAVGKRYDDGVEGYPWSVQSHGPSWDWVTDPPAAGIESIDAVSCGPRSRLCLSSGYYEPRSTKQTIVQNFDGQEWWVAQGVPDVGPSAAVACADSFCVVTGAGAVATFDGTSWTSIPITGPGGAPVQLSGVDCLNAHDCVLVGGYYGGGSKVESALVERWNGTRWRVVAAPTGRAGRSNVLQAVSCVSSSSCVAVGTSHGAPDANLVFTWNGTAWQSTTVPRTGTGLDGVACASSGSCVAVGPNGAALAAAGGTWTLSRVAVPPADSGALPDLTGISYADGRYHAVGSYDRLGDQTAVAESLPG